MAEFELDKHIKVELVKGDIKKDKEFEFKAFIPSKFNIGQAPNGGYLSALCVNAMQTVLPHPHPRVLTTYFLNKCNPDEEAQVFVSKILVARKQSTAMARVVQSGEERIRMLANFTTFDRTNKFTTVRRQFPGSPFEKCVKLDTYDHNVLQSFNRMDMVMEVGSTKTWNKATDNSGVVASYLRFADGRKNDMKALAYFADALYPTPYNMQEFGDLHMNWIPTLEFTVEFFAEPDPEGYVYVYNKCTEVINGTCGIEGSLWDSKKNLVAISRQTAIFSNINIKTMLSKL